MTDERLRRISPLRSTQLGGTKVTFLPDGMSQLRPRAWLPDTDDQVWAAHPEYIDEAGFLACSMGALLIEVGDRALLIDAGLGPVSFPDSPANPFFEQVGKQECGGMLDSLALAGRRPSDIEEVALTHLHPDHFGWVISPAPGSDKPALGHVRCLVAESEWMQRDVAIAQGTPAECINRIERQVHTVQDGEEIFPGVQVLLTPGHTAGHAAYIVTGGSQRLIAFGDAMHTPIQVDHPEWGCWLDHDRELAENTRRRLIVELRKPNTIGFGLHFPDVVFGRVSSDGVVPAWRPLFD